MAQQFYSSVFKGTTLIWSDTGKYTNGRTVLRATDTEGYPFMTASVNIPELCLEEHEMAIKDYSENEGIMDHLIDMGVIGKPECMYHTGNVCIPIVSYLGIKNLPMITI